MGGGAVSGVVKMERVREGREMVEVDCWFVGQWVVRRGGCRYSWPWMLLCQ